MIVGMHDFVLNLTIAYERQLFYALQDDWHALFLNSIRVRH